MDNDTDTTSKDVVQQAPETQQGAQSATQSAPLVSEGHPTDEEIASINAANEAARSVRGDALVKAWMRTNIRWLMAEMDHTREGKSEEERAQLNP